MTVTVGDGCVDNCAGGFNMRAPGRLERAGSTITGSQRDRHRQRRRRELVGGLVARTEFSTSAPRRSQGPTPTSAGLDLGTIRRRAVSWLECTRLDHSQLAGVRPTLTGKANDVAFTGGLVGLNSGIITSTTSTGAELGVRHRRVVLLRHRQCHSGKSGSSGGLVGSNEARSRRASRPRDRDGPVDCRRAVAIAPVAKLFSIVPSLLRRARRTSRTSRL